MKIFILTGEKSGDIHAANLVKELRFKKKDLDIKAWGGKRLISEGVDVVKHIDSISYMGFWEVFTNLFNIYNNFKQCKKDLLRFNPDLIILVDYAGFNLRIAEFAFKNNFKVYYYISPKVWAWKPSRINLIKKYVSKMFVVLPFEKKYFSDRDFSVEYFGNPLLDEIKLFDSNKIIQSDKKIISLFPGSREQEIKKVLPIMLTLVSSFPEYKFIIAATNSFSNDFYKSFVNNEKVEIVFDSSYMIFNSSFLTVVTSGTASLEAALFNVPQIVCYKTSLVSYVIAKAFIRIKFISLVNILLNKKVVAELIQNQFTIDTLNTEFNQLIAKNNRISILAEYKNIYNILSVNSQSPSKDIANNILKVKD